ncbi:MAG: sigma-70 family RNA polymerase sigma factor [Rhodothermales bacterium]
MENWAEILAGSDKDAFEAIVAPYMDLLLAVAERELGFYKELNYIHDDDFTPEEVTGEALLHAWAHRNVRPQKMTLRSWLLGTQYRVVRGLVNRLRAYRRDQAFSLDEPVPTDEDTDPVQDWFWDWYQPDSVLTWEDVIPSQQPEDLEVPLDGDRFRILEDTDERHVLILHQEFEMSLPEVAFTLNRTPIAIAEILEQARVSLSHRLMDEPDDIEHPNPEE